MGAPGMLAFLLFVTCEAGCPAPLAGNPYECVRCLAKSGCSWSSGEKKCSKSLRKKIPTFEKCAVAANGQKHNFAWRRLNTQPGDAAEAAKQEYVHSKDKFDDCGKDGWRVSKSMTINLQRCPSKTQPLCVLWFVNLFTDIAKPHYDTDGYKLPTLLRGLKTTDKFATWLANTFPDDRPGMLALWRIYTTMSQSLGQNAIVLMRTVAKDMAKDDLTLSPGPLALLAFNTDQWPQVEATKERTGLLTGYGADGMTKVDKIQLRVKCIYNLDVDQANWNDVVRAVTVQMEWFILDRADRSLDGFTAVMSEVLRFEGQHVTFLAPQQPLW